MLFVCHILNGLLQLALFKHLKDPACSFGFQEYIPGIFSYRGGEVFNIPGSGCRIGYLVKVCFFLQDDLGVPGVTLTKFF